MRFVFNCGRCGKRVRVHINSPRAYLYLFGRCRGCLSYPSELKPRKKEEPS